MEAIPDNDNPTKQTFDAAHFASLMEGACRRVPLMRNVQLERTLNGLESFTPDGDFIVGEAAEVTGFWSACGLVFPEQEASAKCLQSVSWKANRV